MKHEEVKVVALRQRLLDRGYQPLPVFNWNYSGVSEKDRGKRPSDNGWQNKTGMPVYRDHAQNTGILTGTVYALDIDAEDSTIVTKLIPIAERHFGRTSIRYRANSARCLLPYRFEDAGARKLTIRLSCGKLEFLGRGQQFVAFGKHPSGADYEWRGQSLDEIESDELPLITVAQINAFCIEVKTLWPLAGESKEQAKPNGAGRTKNGKADFRNTCLKEDVEAALRQLSCDCDRETWVKLSRAFRAGGGSYEVFLEWSRKHPQYENDKYLEEQWHSFRISHSVTVATLFDEVFRRYPGWKKPSERGPDYVGPAEAEVEWTGEEGDEVDPTPVFDEEALPLCPQPRPAELYPLAALGSLQNVVEGIAEMVRCDPGLSAQSVLMTAALATAGIANVELPRIGTTGLSLFFVTVAVPSERKSSSDKRALRGVYEWVKELKKEHEFQAKRHSDEVRIYNAAETTILKDKKLDREAKKKALAALGLPPPPLLQPVLAPNAVTVQGLTKEWSRGTLRPVQALTTSEGGMFVAGAAMSRDMRLNTVATFCALWDCTIVVRIQSGDGIMAIGEKRLMIHFMIQLNFVPELFGDPVLRAQGFLSRLLTAWPPSRIGFRDDIGDEDGSIATPAEDEFCRRIYSLVSRYTSSELGDLETLRLDPEARKLWIDYSNEIERAQRPKAPYADLTDVAGKSAEMAGRLAGVLTLYDKPGASIVSAKTMRNAITLARWYLNEALQIAETGMLRPEIVDATELLKWLRDNPEHRSRSGILHFGPRRLRHADKLGPLLKILAGHNLILLSKKGPIHVREATSD